LIMAIRTILLASASVVVSAGSAMAQTNSPPAKDSIVGEVIVTASPLGGDPDRFATIVETVNSDQIAAAGGGNLADALRDVPGVSGTSFAAGASRPVIRGMDANRVKVLEDGLSSSDVSDIGPDHGVPIDPLSTDRIEVVRGAATLRYGSQAIGGVVNAIDDRIPNRLPDTGLEGQVLFAGNTNGDNGEAAVHLDGKVGDLALHADGFGRRASDYDTPLGVQGNSFFRGGGASVGGSYFFNNGNSRTGLAVVQYDAKYGIPSDTTYINMRQTRYMSRSSLQVGDGMGVLQKVSIDLGYANYQHTENEPDGSINSTFQNHEWDSRIETLFGKIGPFSTTAIGVQGGDRRFQALGADGAYLFPTHNQSLAGFVFAEAPAGPFDIQTAIRAETDSIDGTPASNLAAHRHFTAGSGSLGASIDVTSDLKLGLTLTSAARAPAVTELFARGPHDGPQTFETGDPTLTMERSNSVEGTARLHLGKVKIEASAWAAQFQNYIYGQLTGRMCGDADVCSFNGPGDLKELNYSQRDANFGGLEGKASLPLLTQPAGALSLNLLGDTVRARFANGGGDVPRIQPSRLGGGLAWSSKSLDASFMVMEVAAQNHPGAGETPTPGYTDVDAQIAWTPQIKGREITIALVGHNLGDAVIRNAVALNRDVVAQSGRDVRLVFTSKF
jgi:iron complex outermembrane receptor protein